MPGKYSLSMSYVNPKAVGEKKKKVSRGQPKGDRMVLRLPTHKFKQRLHFHLSYIFFQEILLKRKG
jgi:hypothetical protein